MGPPAPFNTSTIGKTSLRSTRINYAKRLRSSTSTTTSPSTHATVSSSEVVLLNLVGYYTLQTLMV
ncbi:hypothetical protein L873DRAFT_1824607, partial [Choiromyces venosus 120613-1]